MTITGNDTVREVIKKYPDAKKIFNKYGLMECGGPLGPKEPISFFATVHRVDPETLLKELNDLAQKGGE
jgi:iron-sulfur cluster repair protein YtfE (RIC family)